MHLGSSISLQVHAGTELAFISSCLHLLQPSHIFTKLQFIIQPVRLQFRYYLFDNIWMKCYKDRSTDKVSKAKSQKGTGITVKGSTLSS